MISNRNSWKVPGSIAPDSLTQRSVMAGLRLLLPAVTATAEPACIVNGPPGGGGHFGTIDLLTGPITQHGSNTPDESLVEKGMKHSTLLSLALVALVLALPVTVAPQAKAATIPVTYSLSGGPTGPPVMSGSTLVLDGLFTGSFTSGNPSLDNAWNPLTYQDHSVIDLITGLLHGSFSVVFKDGDTLTGNVFEDVSAVLANNGMGPFTQTLTFTGGTGQFLGATGQLSGSGNTAGTAPVTGQGAINAPAIPEPSTILLSAAGFAIVLVCGQAGRLRG